MVFAFPFVHALNVMNGIDLAGTTAERGGRGEVLTPRLQSGQLQKQTVLNVRSDTKNVKPKIAMQVETAGRLKRYRDNHHVGLRDKMCMWMSSISLMLLVSTV
jgi:hypothetical protein